MQQLPDKATLKDEALALLNMAVQARGKSLHIARKNATFDALCKKYGTAIGSQEASTIFSAVDAAWDEYTQP